MAGCIGYRNKKTFILFLVYAALYAAYSAFEAGKVCVDFFGDPSGMGDVSDPSKPLNLSQPYG